MFEELRELFVKQKFLHWLQRVTSSAEIDLEHNKRNKLLLISNRRVYLGNSDGIMNSVLWDFPFFFMLHIKELRAH